MVDAVKKNVPVSLDTNNTNKVTTDSIEIDTSSTASIKIGELLSGKKTEKNNDLEKMFDFDGNGKLDEAEKAALEAYQDIKMFDINGDGKLDDAEKAAKKAYKEVKMFDFNKNGKLDPEEKAALDAWKKAQEKQKPAPWWPWFKSTEDLMENSPIGRLNGDNGSDDLSVDDAETDLGMEDLFVDDEKTGKNGKEVRTVYDYFGLRDQLEKDGIKNPDKVIFGTGYRSGGTIGLLFDDPVDLSKSIGGRYIFYPNGKMVKIDDK